jgi:hypothetical protein
MSIESIRFVVEAAAGVFLLWLDGNDFMFS